jgi:integrase
VLLLGVGGLRWGEAAALRVGDVDFRRRRIELHRNAVQVGTKVVIGTLKANKSRTVVLPNFVIDALAETAKGKGRDDLLWPSASGGYTGLPRQRRPGYRARSRAAKRQTPLSPGSRPTRYDRRRPRSRTAPGRTQKWYSACWGMPARP